ncbi:MAG: HAMP domain-containing sensor histidine kinase [Trueperaceae bacterium]|nr:HAMP domain-containing sensor histidine kinase [Trueperaceae bacterium]
MPPDEVGRLAEALDALLVRVRDARDAQRAFLAETSHELRTPLTSLRGFLRRARRKASPEVAGDLEDAERIAAGMARLVEDLLELSRGRLLREITPHLVDVGEEVVAPVVAEFPGVTVRPGPASTVLGEPERLRQALRNLVANAERAAGPSGRVNVGWTLGGGHVCLEVRDDGPGLSPEVEARLFEPFAPGPGGGSGLGLAIAKRLMEAHGGTIAVARREGETVFELRLPALDEDDESE